MPHSEPSRTSAPVPSAEAPLVSRRRVLAAAAGAALALTGISPSLRLARGPASGDSDDSVWDSVRDVLWPPAGAVLDSPLEKEIEDYIRGLRRKGRVASDEQTSWSVYDFRTSNKLVAINEDRPMQAASMIKPLVALAWFYRADEKSAGYGESVRRRMEAMIQHSSNEATNAVMDDVGRMTGLPGPKAVERTLKDRASGVFQHVAVVEHIPRDGRCYRNRASAHDYSRFLYALWTDQFPQSPELKRLMSLPNADRIYSGARKVPSGTVVYDKTGTTARLCGNMGLLVARGRDGRTYPYTVIGIIEKEHRARNFTSWMRARGDVIREVSNLTYAYLKKIHELR